jgi:hypothetical protein
MWRIWRAPNNASKWQIGFNLAFKGLNTNTLHIIKLIWNKPIYSTFLHVVGVQARLQEECSISRNYQIVKKKRYPKFGYLLNIN